VSAEDLTLSVPQGADKATVALIRELNKRLIRLGMERAMVGYDSLKLTSDFDKDVSGNVEHKLASVQVSTRRQILALGYASYSDKANASKATLRLRNGDMSGKIVSEVETVLETDGVNARVVPLVVMAFIPEPKDRVTLSVLTSASGASAKATRWGLTALGLF